MLILKSGIRNEKGFTLLEFVVVLLILGLVFGLALPRLYRNFDKDPLRLSANLLAEAIRRLRHHSISEGELFRLRVTLPDGKWVAEGLDGNGKWLKLAKSPVESSRILEGVRLRDVRIGKRASSDDCASLHHLLEWYLNTASYTTLSWINGQWIWNYVIPY